jgi:uncharacterized protein YegJ (DUF2314 family)
MVLLLGCSRAGPPATVVAAASDAAPATELFARGATATHFVHFTPEPRVALEAAKARCAGLSAALEEHSFDDPPPTDRAVWGVKAVDWESGMDTIPNSFFIGLSDAQRAAELKSKTMFEVGYSAPRAKMRRMLHDADALTACLAKETGGLIWDEDTRQMFALDAWQKARLDAWVGDVPIVHLHITVHAYNNGELARSVTLGMAKLGLPDLVVQAHPTNDAELVSWMIAFVAQALVERGSLAADGTLDLELAALAAPIAREMAAAAPGRGGAGKARLRLVEAKPDEGDAENRLLEIRGSADGLEAQSAALAALFGRDEEVFGAAADDTELNAASARARKALVALRPTFARGIPPMTLLHVKAPFTTDRGGVEWMWVEVTSWNGKRLSGVLVSEPLDVKALKQGARVKVKIDEVFDYVYWHDGKKDGNETTEILKRRQR